MNAQARIPSLLLSLCCTLCLAADRDAETTLFAGVGSFNIESCAEAAKRAGFSGSGPSATAVPIVQVAASAGSASAPRTNPLEPVAMLSFTFGRESAISAGIAGLFNVLPPGQQLRVHEYVVKPDPSQPVGRVANVWKAEGRTRIFLANRNGTQATIHLTSSSGALEKSILIKDAVPRELSGPANLADFEAEKAFWLQMARTMGQAK